MKFKNQIKRNGAVLNRGDSCAYHSMTATYIGSFSTKGGGWKHMLIIDEGIDEVLITVASTNEIIFKDMMPKNLEGQLCLC